MPRHNYYKAQPYVKALFKKHGLVYVEKSLLTGTLDIYRSISYLLEDVFSFKLSVSLQLSICSLNPEYYCMYSSLGTQNRDICLLNEFSVF